MSAQNVTLLGKSAPSQDVSKRAMPAPSKCMNSDHKTAVSERNAGTLVALIKSIKRILNLGGFNDDSNNT